MRNEQYSGKEGAGFEPVVDRHVTEFVDLIERKYLSTPSEFRPIEFSHRSQYFALDVISDVGFGEAIGFLANDKDMYKYVETNDAFFPVLAIILNMPWLSRVMRTWPLSKAMPKVGDEYGLGPLMGYDRLVRPRVMRGTVADNRHDSFARKLVDQRFEPDAEPGNDMMQAHIRNGLTRKELMAEVLLEMIAGSDSTATAIRMIMLCLMTTPAALRSLQREIDSAVTAGRISSPVTDAEAYQLPYLQAVIKEGLRMFPPSTGHNYKEVPEGGSEIHGYHLPGGTQMGINIQQMMRDKGNFGPDASKNRLPPKTPRRTVSWV